MTQYYGVVIGPKNDIIFAPAYLGKFSHDRHIQPIAIFIDVNDANLLCKCMQRSCPHISYSVIKFDVAPQNTAQNVNITKIKDGKWEIPDMALLASASFSQDDEAEVSIKLLSHLVRGCVDVDFNIHDFRPCSMCIHKCESLECKNYTTGHRRVITHKREKCNLM